MFCTYLSVNLRPIPALTADPGPGQAGAGCGGIVVSGQLFLLSAPGWA